MALTNALLKSMGIEGDQRDQIMAAHQETLESIRNERDGLRDIAAKVPDLEAEIEELRKADKGEELQAKLDEAEEAREKLLGDIEALKGEKASVEGEFESYRNGVEAERANAEKLELYKGLLREIGLDEKRVEKAARLKPLDELTVEDGKLAGYDELAKAEADEWADFIPQSNGTHGQQVPTPPKGGNVPEGADPEIAKMLEQRHADLYGRPSE